MLDILSDMVRHTGCNGIINIFKVTGTDETTEISAFDDDKLFFVQAKLKEPIPEFKGEFGVSNLKLLNGLLNFTSYQTDDATFNVSRRQANGMDFADQFEFRDANGVGADFRLMPANLVPDQAVISNIPWDVSFEPTTAAIQEFTQLAGLYSEIDKNFTVKTVDGNIQFLVGDENSSTHKASMIFQKGVEGTIGGNILWSIDRFLTTMKIGGDHTSRTINITSRGVLGVDIETKFGQYSYYLRAKR